MLKEYQKIVIKSYDQSVLLTETAPDSWLGEYLADLYRIAFGGDAAKEEILQRMKNHYPADFQVADIVTDTEMLCPDSRKADLQYREYRFTQKARTDYERAGLDAAAYPGSHIVVDNIAYLDYLMYQRRLSLDGHFFACYSELIEGQGELKTHLSMLADTVHLTAEQLLALFASAQEAGKPVSIPGLSCQLVYDAVTNRFLLQADGEPIPVAPDFSLPEHTLEQMEDRIAQADRKEEMER